MGETPMPPFSKTPGLDFVGNEVDKKEPGG